MLEVGDLITGRFKKSSITILYGSDTGTAQDYAYFLSKRLRYLSLNPTIAALDDYPLKKLVTDTSFLIVICATVGQGEVPRNGKKFMKFILKKKLPSDLLNHVSLTTFGLGDSSYPKYNHAIRKIHTRLGQLGCTELCSSCEADEQSSEGLDGYYTVWEQTLIDSLKKFFPTLTPLNDEAILSPSNRLSIETGDVENESDSVLAKTRADIDNEYADTERRLKVGKIKSLERITPSDHFQDVRHLTVEASDLDYQPGDTMALFPTNSAEEVQKLLDSQKKWLSVADKPLKIHGVVPYIEGGLISPEKLTLRRLLTHHLDIMAIPTRSFFFSIWRFVNTDNEDGKREVEKLKEFCDFENSEELYDYANRPRRSIAEFLVEFENNLEIPVQYVFDLFPKIKPRLYSIASKPSENTIELVIGVVEYQTIIKRIRRGLCSRWLKSLNVGDDIIFTLHKQKLKFGDKPLILVGPGTGIAPMKSLIEHRIGSQDMYFFFGFRNETKDYFFKSQWDEFSKKDNFTLFPCISRSDKFKKQYVQNGIFDQKELIQKLILEEEAVIYLCGSNGPMPRQVRETILEILKISGMTEEEAAQYLLSMENTGRYIQETW
ncbi:NADPH-dependent diflavin oxidoreductase 1 [[Candida] jaroonii]|uniref:NADPH-dependent diflavin oxidoreductase 1 n=1 Tax=[Candida] jaroonii TaxID=467808 RepID=A0ACA9Y6Z8_9ASCO|nr:NADPH-dependent diflavin oxidoreductase 1 [[Candida] jaroonii]